MKKIKSNDKKSREENKEGMNKIKDLYKLKYVGHRHIDSEKDIKDANFANNKRDKLPKFLIANDYFRVWDNIALKQSKDPRMLIRYWLIIFRTRACFGKNYLLIELHWRI